MTFSAPPYAGVAACGQAEPTGRAVADSTSRPVGEIVNLDQVEQYCESPIEAMLAKEIAAKFADVEWAGFNLVALPAQRYRAFIELPEHGLAFIVPQAIVEGSDEESDWSYRVDFLLVCGRRPAFRRIYAIECDGHEWHEKTKEQVARDKLRDRRMIMDDIIPVRFSGSEIHADVAACAWYLHCLANGAIGQVLGEQASWAELKKHRAAQSPRDDQSGGE